MLSVLPIALCWTSSDKYIVLSNSKNAADTSQLAPLANHPQRWRRRSYSLFLMILVPSCLESLHWLPSSLKGKSTSWPWIQSLKWSAPSWCVTGPCSLLFSPPWPSCSACDSTKHVVTTKYFLRLEHSFLRYSQGSSLHSLQVSVYMLPQRGLFSIPLYSTCQHLIWNNLFVGLLPVFLN